MNFVTRRLLSVIPLLFVVTVACFGMLQLLPGDPIITILGNSAADPVKVAALTKELGLDRPFPAQYAAWAGRFITGDFGHTYNQGGGEQVRKAIQRDFPVTFELALVSLALALFVAVILGTISAYRAGTKTDRAISVFNYAALSSPGFVVGPILIFFIGLQFGWLPVGQFVPWSDGIIDHIRSMILPCITLAFGLIPNFSRLLRTDMESTLKEDFILMAKAKGISDRRILLRHALRPSSLTLITVAGVSLGGLISGAVIVERLYNLPGLGTLIISGIAQREYLLVLAVVTIVTIVILLTATLVDVLYGFVDPRVRAARSIA